MHDVTKRATGAFFPECVWKLRKVKRFFDGNEDCESSHSVKDSEGHKKIERIFGDKAIVWPSICAVDDAGNFQRELTVCVRHPKLNVVLGAIEKLSLNAVLEAGEVQAEEAPEL